ncbi:MAG: tetratricopeptide repeat protein [Bacteroidales bacterium]|nr:tetratricopeptide repeat protein [Bacteroidales bacterium]
MKKTLLFLLIVALFSTACEGPQKDERESGPVSLEESIRLQEAKVYDADQNKLSRQDASVLVNLYEKFANKNPEDTLAPEYLFRASDITMNLRRPGQTIRLFDRILTDYPDFEKAPAVLFLKAFVYEDQMQDFDNAKKFYELFLEKYPDDDFADDAEISLKNLGKSPEELIMEFEKKN